MYKIVVVVTIIEKEKNPGTSLGATYICIQYSHAYPTLHAYVTTSFHLVRITRKKKKNAIVSVAIISIIII